MTGFLLSIHVLAAILAIGPVAVAASMFPPAARAAIAAPGDRGKAAVVRVLHRITRVYAVIGVLVPLSGVATGAALGVLGDTWLIVSMVLTAGAALLLVAFVLPGQERAVATIEAAESDRSGESGAVTAMTRSSAGRLAMHTGLFNLVWAVVVVLMIYRPGSTTGAGL